jgi:dTDP-glucose 4,6-dehydratase
MGSALKSDAPILITGGAGFIGSALVRRSVADGINVVNVDALTYAANLDSLGSALHARSHYFEQANILDSAALQRVFEQYRPRAVMHLAAESHVDRSIDAPESFMETNVTGTLRLLQEARRYHASLAEPQRSAFRFIHVSTDEVFGSLGPAGSFRPDSRYDPHSPYAASKAAADHLARAWYTTYGVPVIVTNCSNNYGPHQFPEKLIPLVVLKALHGEPLPVYGNGSNVRDWIFVDDHVDALLRVLELGVPGETYLFGGCSERRNIDVVNDICDLLDEMQPDPAGSRRRLIRFVADRPGHDARYAIDASASQQQLQWQPKHSFSAGLRKTVQWYLDNREWVERVQSGLYRGERLGMGSSP